MTTAPESVAVLGPGGFLVAAAAEPPPLRTVNAASRCEPLGAEARSLDDRRAALIMTRRPGQPALAEDER